MLVQRAAPRGRAQVRGPQRGKQLPAVYSDYSRRSNTCKSSPVGIMVVSSPKETKTDLLVATIELRRRKPRQGRNCPEMQKPDSFCQTPQEQKHREDPATSRRRLSNTNPEPNMALTLLWGWMLVQQAAPRGRAQVRGPQRGKQLPAVVHRASQALWGSWSWLRLKRPRRTFSCPPLSSADENTDKAETVRK